MLSAPMVRSLKARQGLKIRELGAALVSVGLITLDEQAKALGLPRSTTWTILKGTHKSSGLSAFPNHEVVIAINHNAIEHSLVPHGQQ